MFIFGFLYIYIMYTETSFLISVLALALLGIILFFKKSEQIQRVANFLLILLTTLFLQNTISPTEKSAFMTGIIGALIGVNFLLSFFFKSKIWRWVFPFLSIIALFILGKNELFFNDYSTNLGNLKVLSIVIMGFFIGILSSQKTYIMNRLFHETDNAAIVQATQIILIGMFIIPATFFVSWFGIFLLAVGFFLYDVYDKNENGVIIISLLALSTISQFIQLYNVESIDLSIGKVLAGIIIGSSSYSLLILAIKSRTVFIKAICILLAVFLVVAVTLLDNIHPAYGGIDSFLAALVGMAIANLIYRDKTVGIMLYPTFLAVGLIAPSSPFPVETQPEVEKTESTAIQSKAQIEEPQGMDASNLSGKYTIDSKTAKIAFQLGPKGGTTKGEILGFEGTVDFGTDITSTKFAVKLPVKNLTTHNSMRDRSVLGGAYLNEPKFPMMKFTSSGMTPKDDGYHLTGKFNMLGKTNEENLFIKYIGDKGGKQLFIGKSSLDRTKYGMLSSPQEGNVVDFTFIIELTK